MSTTTSGLTRRRGGGGGGAGDGDGSSGIGRSNSSNNMNDSTPETSYESGENGHKIAFDPRDISESAERSKQPKLTLMEEVLLLGLKDKQVSPRHVFSYRRRFPSHRASWRKPLEFAPDRSADLAESRSHKYPAMMHDLSDLVEQTN